MSDAIFQLHGLRDPRLSVHATSTMPAWLWSTDGTRVLWANPVAAKLFSASNAAELSKKIFGPADQHRRQVNQLGARLSQSGAVRVERLRGFGAQLGSPVTCACTRLSFSDGSTAILIVALEMTARQMSFDERVASLLNSLAKPALAFTADGALAGTNNSAKNLFAHVSTYGTVEFDAARLAALLHGDADLKTKITRGTLYRAGSGHDTVLVAVFDAIDLPDVVEAPLPPVPLPAIIQDATSAADIKADTIPADTTSESLVVKQTGDTHWSVLPNDKNDVHAEVEAAPQDNIAPAIEPKIEPSPVQAIESRPSSPPDADKHHVAATLAEMDGSHPSPRRHPLRFMWHMDSDGRFSLGSDEFTRLIGPRTAAAFGRLWTEIADAIGIDPEGIVAKAIATRDTWSGIVVNWPSDMTGGRLPVELSGLPVFDRARNFIGYRGFGVCRDLEGLARLAVQRREEILYSARPAPDSLITSAPIVLATQTPSAIRDSGEIIPNEAVLDTPINVVPFRPANEPKPSVLTAVESNAFDELARRLAAGLDGETTQTETEKPTNDHTTTTPANEHSPAFLQQEAMAPTVNSLQDTQLLDRLSVGVLVYRLDRLMYANRAFLSATGFNDLHQLTEAGGLDALYVEPSTGAGASTSEGGTPVMISALKPAVNSGASSQPLDARLFAISWDGDAAMALMFSGARAETAAAPPVSVAATHAEESTLAEDLSTILDTTTEGIVMFDGLGRIVSCNRGAEALFGRNNDEIAALNLIDLFAPESQREVLAYLENAKSATIASLLDHGRDMLGRTRDGRTIPLSMTMGRTRPDGARFFAVFNDQTPAKKSESDVRQAQRQAERATVARSEVLTRISHEVRMPLNAIIGFADVMIEERFGALGNERYAEYMKDIRASGQRVMTIIDDLLDLTRIESGNMELAFANQDLNSLIEQCVAVMQPQANRERIIIRTSLAHALPNVKADARALRQIALNLIGSSIHLANAGGQVIVSTATTDFGDIVLRVRDTGLGLNDNEIAAAMAPFRTTAAMDQISSDNSTISLSLTKALVEANRAKFQIKTAAHSGTLIEVLFSNASVIA